MSSSDQENRKDVRRDHIKKKYLDKKMDNSDRRDQNKIKKQFKRHKEDIRQEEIWEEWNDEVY